MTTSGQRDRPSAGPRRPLALGVLAVAIVAAVGWSVSDTESPSMAAHVDHDGRAGVFYDLRGLEVGDEISVVAADGSMQSFVVDSLPTNVKKSALPAEQIFRTDGPATLVTCGGRFDRVARSYEENTIVTARLAS